MYQNNFTRGKQNAITFFIEEDFLVQEKKVFLLNIYLYYIFLFLLL